MPLDIGKMSITRDVIFDEAIKQEHAANTTYIPYHDSESDADDPAAAVKEEADTAAEVVAKEAVEEEGQETAAAAPEHRYPHHENRQAPLRYREHANLGYPHLMAPVVETWLTLLLSRTVWGG